MSAEIGGRLHRVIRSTRHAWVYHRPGGASSRYQHRILEALSDLKRVSAVDTVILYSIAESTAVSAFCSLRVGLPCWRHLVLKSTLTKLTPLSYLPHTLTSLTVKMSCVRQDLTLLNVLSQLRFLCMFFDTQLQRIETENDRCILRGDIKLQQLQCLIMESQYGRNHCRGILMAPDLTLQHIPTSCQVSL